MQIVKYSLANNVLTVGFKEDNFLVFSVVPYTKNKTRDELLQEAYRNVKHTIDYEKTLNTHSFITEEMGEEFTPSVPKPIKLNIDFDNLKGKVLDQYGDVFSTNIEFSIEGTSKAKIQNNSIIEEEATEDIGYYVVAKYEGLEEKQKRIIYSTKIVEEKIDSEKIAMAEAIVDLNNQIEILKEEIEILKGGK